MNQLQLQHHDNYLEIEFEKPISHQKQVFDSAEETFDNPYLKQLFAISGVKCINLHDKTIIIDITDDYKEEFDVEVLEICAQFKMIDELKITIEETPNPLSKKLVFSYSILPTGQVLHLKDSQDAALYPQLLELFGVIGVKELFVADNFITIEKEIGILWNEILVQVQERIKNDRIKIKLAQKLHNNEFIGSEIEKKIIDLIDERIKPFVRQDGGDISFHSFVDGVVKVRLSGACSSCPSASITLKSGVEQLLCYYLDEVKSVEAVD